MIHSTAIVAPGAVIGAGTEIGPYSVIECEVQIGPGCTVGPYVHITGRTRIGAKNLFHTGCVIGDAPQDLKYKGDPTRLAIGDNNVFRENVTVHRSNTSGTQTIIGSHNLLMAGAHVGHNSEVGSHVIIANGALLGGHVSVADRAFISGNCLVHQFVRVGTLALMQGGAAISKDLPPFTVARGDNGICGLNTVGLRRAGFTTSQRLVLKKVYHALFRSGLPLSRAISAARAEFSQEPATILLDFIANSRRGVVSERRLGRRTLTDGD